MTMRDWPGLRRVFRLPLNAQRLDADVDAELAFHIEGRIDELMASGMSRADAEREARARFGDFHRIEAEVQRLDRSSYRRRTIGDWLEALGSDVRYAIRGLRRQPVFAVVVTLTLTLGIASTAAIYHAVDRVVLHPLPYPNADRIVYVGWKWKSAPTVADALAARKFVFWREQSRVFDGLATSGSFDAALGDDPSASHVQALRVTQDFFHVLGVQPALGRTLGASDFDGAGAPVAVLSNATWMSRFAGDRGIVGRVIRLDGHPYTVVGVMPPSFEVVGQPGGSDLFVPLVFTPEQLADGANNYQTFGRLRDGVTMAQAQSDMATVFEKLRTAYPNLIEKDDAGAAITTYQKIYVGDLATPLWIMLGATVFVLLLACVNVANLLLARTLGRQREFAVRAALGAGRARIARQVIIEMVLLGLIAAVLGTLVSLATVRGIVALAQRELLRPSQLHLDPRVLIVTTLVAVGASIVIGGLVALSATRFDLAKNLAEAGRAGSAGRRQRMLRSGLVAAESALAMTLLVGAGLLIASFARVLSVDPGYQREGVFTARITQVPAGYDDPSVVDAFTQRVLDRLRATPGAVSAGAASTVPLVRGMNIPMTIDGRPNATLGGTEWRSITPGYFKTFGIPIKLGRDVSAGDVASSPAVVIVSSSLVKQYFPNESPLGKRILIGRYRGRLIGPRFDDPPREIVGVVPDIRDQSLDQRRARVTVWVPQAQVISGMLHGLPTFAVRASDAGVAASALRGAIAEADPLTGKPEIAAMTDLVSQSLVWRRFGVVLMSIFAGLALVLTCIGIYGVVSYSVMQRVHEIGVRMALGARPANVVALVVAQGVRPAIVGLAIGLAIALDLSKFLRQMLYGVGPRDPLALGSVAATFVVVALVASFLPARRASRVDPLTALRGEG